MLHFVDVNALQHLRVAFQRIVILEVVSLMVAVLIAIAICFESFSDNRQLALVDELLVVSVVSLQILSARNVNAIGIDFASLIRFANSSLDL